MLPYRPRDDETIIGTPQDVDDVRDHGRDHLHVVYGQIARAAEAERAREVGGADADGEHVISMRVQYLGDRGERGGAGFPIHHGWRFEDRHELEPLRLRPAVCLDGGECREE